MTSTIVDFRLALAVALLAGCAEKARTQIMVGVATDFTAPAEMNRIEAVVTRTSDGAIMYERGWDIPGRPNEVFALPGSIGLYAEDSAPTLRIVVKALDTRPNALAPELLSRVAVVSMIPEKTLFMRMGLVWTCLYNADCPAERSSCVEGRCKKPEIDSRLLPAYTPAAETTVVCNSGTTFIATDTKQPLVPNATCAADEQCIEGTCYKRPAGQVDDTYVVEGYVFGLDGAPLADAFVTVTDGRTGIGVRDLSGAARTDAAGKFSAQVVLPREDPPARELVLTVARAQFAPQVIGIPLKTGVSTYQTPVFLSPLSSQAVMTGPTTIRAEAGQIAATIVVPANRTMGHKLRYALLNPYDMPSRLDAAGAGAKNEARQPTGVVYVELVDANDVTQTQLPLTVNVMAYPLRTVQGSQIVQTTRLDAQGQWRAEGTPTSTGGVVTFQADKNGYWGLSRLVTTACAKGKVVKKGGAACPGTRVRALGEQGLASFDATGAMGDFCIAGAAGESSSVFVGGVRRNVFMPQTAGTCSAAGGACADLGTIEVDDCNPATVKAIGTTKLGDACLDAAKCGPSATCFQGSCITDGRVRVSLAWSGKADFDLHVLTPSGKKLSAESTTAEVEDGRLDIHQCRVSCAEGNHVENVLIAPNAKGNVTFWVRNEDGVAGGPFRVELVRDGAVVDSLEGTLPATKGAESTMKTVTLN